MQYAPKYTDKNARRCAAVVALLYASFRCSSCNKTQLVFLCVEKTSEINMEMKTLVQHLSIMLSCTMEIWKSNAIVKRFSNDQLLSFRYGQTVLCERGDGKMGWNGRE